MEEMLKKLRQYNQSEENAGKIKPYVQLAERFTLLAKQYADTFEELYAKVQQEVWRTEYAKGGQMIHRGFYSPSCLDVITGNCNRGHLLKRIPLNGKYDYAYTFDQQGNLICCKQHERIEILIHDESCVLGLEFDHGGAQLPERISECRYEDGKLVRYACALLNPYGKNADCMEINVETFDYADGILTKFNWYRFSPAIKSLSHNEITLFRDAAGNLLEYTDKELDLPPFLEATRGASGRYPAKKKEKLFHDIHRKATN